VPEWLRDRVLDGTWAAGDPNTREFESAILDGRMQGFRVIFIITIPLLALCLLASFLVDDIVLKGDTSQGDMGERGQMTKLTATPMALSDAKMDNSRQACKGH
jgi:hypothetical protein